MKTTFLNLTTTIFLALTLLTTSSLSAQKSKKVQSPQRGFVSTQPATTWEEGLLSGNGTIGANVMSRPLKETIIFTHERMFLPQGLPTMPPDNGNRLFEIRSLIDRKLYKQASQLAFDFSGQTDFMYPDPFVPVFDMNIEMEENGSVKNYIRSVNFATGEAIVRYDDNRGTFERKLFVSRADQLVVMLITAPKGALNCRLDLVPRQVEQETDVKKVSRSLEVFNNYVCSIKRNTDKNSLVYYNEFTKAYPGSIHAIEGVAQIVNKGGTTQVEDHSLIVTNADQLLIFVDISTLYDPQDSNVEKIKKRISALGESYDNLLKRHVNIHGELFNRMRLDLGGDKDRNLSSEALLASSSYEKMNPALIEKVFDAARYNIISCTGELPPNLQGLWGGNLCPGLGKRLYP